MVAPEESYSYAVGEQWVKTHYVDEDVVYARYEVCSRGILAGTITSGGVPLAGATVQIYENLTGLLLDNYPVETNAGGYFEMSLYAPADYRVAVQGTGTALVELVVSVATGQTTPIVLDLAGPGSIAGSVANLQSEAVRGAVVELRTGDGATRIADPVTAGSA